MRSESIITGLVIIGKAEVMGSSRASQESRELLELVFGRPISGESTAFEIAQPRRKVPRFESLRNDRKGGHDQDESLALYLCHQL